MSDEIQQSGGKASPSLACSSCDGLGWIDEAGMPCRECLGKGDTPTVDDLIAVLESHGLGWSLDHTGRMIEARVWRWPAVVGRYRPEKVEPLAQLLARAMFEVDWLKDARLKECQTNGRAESAGGGKK